MIINQEGFELLREIFTSAGEGIILSNKEGKIQFANPRAEGIFRYDEGELIGKKVEVLLPDALKPNHHKHREKYMEHPKARPMGQGLDLEGKRKDGTIVPIEISLSAFRHEDELYVISFIIDITKRKNQEKEIEANRQKLKQYAENLEQRVKERTRELEHLNMGLQSQIHERRLAEQALKESQKLYQAISRNFPNGIINVLDKNFDYIFVDGSLKNRLPKNSSSVIGKPYLERFPNDLQHTVSLYLEELKAGDSPTIEIELDEKFYRLRSTTISEDQYLVVEEDITSAKRVENEIIKSLERERELNELKSRFVSMASHEFRTPLSTILSSASLIGRYEENDQQDKREKHINKIKSSVQNLTNILNNFLSIEKVERGHVKAEIQEMNIEELLDETVEELKEVLRGNQSIIREFKLDKKIVFSDPRLLKNILINLISNASKYSGEDQKIILNVTTSKKELEIIVQDYGIGIPQSEQKNLFQPFYRAENVTNIQGTGLGLNIIKKYVELLNGNINFTSEEQKGTTFIINLPLNQSFKK